MKTKATPTREHRVLIRLLQKALSESGRSYGQVAITTGMSRSGVHHFVNGTDRRFPSTEKYVLLVRALGGDPAAEEWLDPYKAAAASYGKDVRRAAIPVRVIAPHRSFQASGDGCVAVGGNVVGGVTTGAFRSVISSHADQVVERDASKPQRPAGPKHVKHGTVLIFVVAVLLVQALLWHYLASIGHHSTVTPPPASQFAEVYDPYVARGTSTAIKIYSEPGGVKAVQTVDPGMLLPDACLVDINYVDDAWIEVLLQDPRKTSTGRGYISARFVANADELSHCITPARGDLLGQ